MSKPIVVSIPHHLGKEEALRRIKGGLGRVQTSFAAHLNVLEETWTDDHLAFRISALGQVAGGTIDVGEDHVRLEVQLPWMLAMLAEKAQALIQRQGQFLLEKK